jgi:GT2 family glycosyltransferase
VGDFGPAAHSAPVSVLMAVYAGDRVEWVSEALRTIREQTIPPAQTVVVQDGPVSTELSAVLEAAGVELVVLPENGGLAAALQAGLQRCSYELVARMDADDLAEPQRLERQVSVFARRPELSVLGGYVAEFRQDPAQPYAIRRVETGPALVARVAKWRCPLNHPTVMFRRDDVRAVGGYDGFSGMEDYFLWAKLLAAGKVIDNLPEVVVRQRAGLDLGRRRGGWHYLRTELGLFRAFVGIGFLTWWEALLGLTIRVPVRLVPPRLRWWVYRRFLRRSTET